MGKTIIQTIGPLYGEVVNGTVFGRPNGSIYVPIQNVITQSLIDATKYVRYNATQGQFYLCNSQGVTPFAVPDSQLHIVAESQDLQNYISIQLSDTADFAKTAQFNANAGQFNIRAVTMGGTDPADPVFSITAGVKYYARALLIAGSGEPVATSDVIELTGVVQ